MGRTLPWTGLVLLVPCFLLHRDDFGARTFTEPRASASGFSCGYAPLYYKILISSRAATIAWWDKRFACHRRAVAGVWLRYAPLYYKILISSRAATIAWWDRRFACHRRL